MKSLIVLTVTLLSAFAFADAPLLAPYCYRGEMESVAINGKTEKKEVFLSLSGVQGNYYLVNQFSLGAYSHGYSGQLVSENTLQFNDNDDFIPGGNASRNIDIELTFNSKGARGTFAKYVYQKDGVGGFGQAGGTLVEQGRIRLQRCQVKVVND